MNVDANKRLVARFYDEVWDQGNLPFASEVFADDHVRHDLRPTQAPPGAAGAAGIAEQFRRAFPDIRWHVDLLLAEGDLVAPRWTASGTHTGPWGGHAPTGKTARFSGVNSVRQKRSGELAHVDMLAGYGFRASGKLDLAGLALHSGFEA
jgi:predicted ester cyclase